jgi:hypothetical protein
MTNRVQKAIDIFLDALNNGELIAGDCTKCAVGNLVKEGMGYTDYNRDTLICIPHGDGYGKAFLNWSFLFYTEDFEQIVLKNPRGFLKKYPEIKQQIDSTGFTLKELMAIEYEFETSSKINMFNKNLHTSFEIRQDQVKALGNVIELMMKFDDCKENVQEVFTNKVKVYETV